MKVFQNKISQILAGLFLPMCALADGSDNFNDNSKDNTKWGTDVNNALGVLTEQNQRLEYICNSPLSDGEAYRPWKLERFPVNGDWTVQVDTFNNTTPTLNFQVNSGGFSLFGPTTTDNEIYLELYAAPFGAPVNKGFVAHLDTAAAEVGSVDIGVAGNEPVMGAVRMEYVAATKVVTCLYDADTSDGYQWINMASFGLAGAGGTTANTDWALANDQQFSIWVYGFSELMTVASGELYLDNFAETGGAAPSGAPSPVPVGSFHFGFPTNNPLLTAIVNITGNYQGVIPTPSRRNYNLDVAEDEFGKLSGMATIDGILDDTGSPQLSGGTGAIKTVDGKPMAQVKGKFSGTRDGLPATGSGSVVGTVEAVDIGGGTNGVSGTASGKSKVAGIPFSVRNVPIQIETPPAAMENLKKNWSIQLIISNSVVNGKQLIVASALLVLPNGDTISYPEKNVKYSTAQGYKLSFKKGINISANPNRVDKKSSVNIQGLTFVQEGDTWEPTGGTINYRFLGQQGTADLLDFETP